MDKDKVVAIGFGAFVAGLALGFFGGFVLAAPTVQAGWWALGYDADREPRYKGPFPTKQEALAVRSTPGFRASSVIYNVGLPY